MSTGENIDKVILEKLETMDEYLDTIFETIIKIRSQNNMATYLMLSKESHKKRKISK